jgi:Domain of unknown function (DUF5666)
MTRLALFSLILVSSLAIAQAPTRVRGTISSIQGDTLLVKSRDGKDLQIQLAPDAQVSTTRKGSAADFKPGSYVGVTSVKGADGRLVARRVHALGPQVPQMHAPWDSIPDSMMTNATLESTAQVGAGTELMLKNKDGEQKIMVTPQTEYFTFAPGTRADLKAGEQIFTSAARQGDKLVAQRITVSKDGVNPPQ